MAEKPKKKSRGSKGWWRPPRLFNQKDDVNNKPDDLSKHRHKPPGDQTHGTPRDMSKNKFHFFTKNKSHKEKDERQNISAETDRGAAAADGTVKDLSTEMEQIIPTGTDFHSKTFTKSISVSIKDEIFNQKQEENAFTESLLGTESYSGINPTHIVNEDLHPGLEEKGAGGYDRSADTPVDAESQMKKLLASFRDIELHKITKFYRQRLEDAIGGFADGVGLALLNENIINSQQYQEVRRLVERESGNEASEFLLNIVIESGAKSGRAMWEIFVKMQSTKPKLRRILNEIQEKGCNLLNEANWSQIVSNVPHYLEEIHNQHKEALCKQCEKPIVTNGRNEEFVSLDKYTDLQIISSPRQRSLVEHELLSRGKEHEKWQKLNVKQLLEKVQIDQLFRSSFGRTSLSGTSVVTGVAGIGKTTLVRKIVHGWATGKIYQQFNFVFLFKFRELNDIRGKTSLKQLVLHSYRYFGKHLERVWEEPNNILIIFDGLDEFEAKIDFSDQQRNTATEYHCFNPECQCEVSDIVRCLVQGKVLKGCSVLITSRPTALESLDQAGVSLWAEILGFFKEERKEYFQRFFVDKEIAAEVFAYVEQNDILYTLCFNPCYCCIICSTLQPLFEQLNTTKIPLPETVSDLFSSYIVGLLKRWGCDVENRRKLLLKIGAMAYEGLCKRKLIFYDDDFSRHGLEPSQFTSGFMMEILEEDTSTKAVVHAFPHLTIQEFLAALSVLVNPPPQGVEHILNNAYNNSDGRFEIFLRFLIGLSSSSSAQKLQHNLGSFPESSTKQVKDWLRAQLEEDFKNVHSAENKRTLLDTFYLLYESQDTQLMRKLLGSMTKTEFSGVTLNMVDCRVLATVLEPQKTIEELNLVYCGIETEHIQRLGPVLHKCKKLSLKDNNLKDAGVHRLCETLSRADCKIETLELNNNGLTDACIEELCCALDKNKTLKMLNLSSNENVGNRINKFTDKSNLRLKNLTKQRKNQIQICLFDIESMGDEG